MFEVLLVIRLSASLLELVHAYGHLCVLPSSAGLDLMSVANLFSGLDCTCVWLHCCPTLYKCI